MNESALKIKLQAIIGLASEITVHNFDLNARAIEALAENTIEEMMIESKMATRIENAPFRA